MMLGLSAQHMVCDYWGHANLLIFAYFHYNNEVLQREQKLIGLNIIL